MALLHKMKITMIHNNQLVSNSRVVEKFMLFKLGVQYHAPKNTDM